jgi:hypothetical protein
MKRVALLFPLAVVIVALTAFASFAGRASAATFVFDPGVLCTIGSTTVVSGEGFEEEDACEGVTTDNIGDGVPICVTGVTYSYLEDQDEDYDYTAADLVADLNDSDVPAALGACAPTSRPAPPPAREAYCSVAGNTNPFTGDPIPAGTFLDLLAGQANTDKHYTGDVPAWYVEGVGLTCSLTPAQAALAAASTQRVGAAGDPEIPIPGIPDYAIYTFVPAK